MAITDKPPRKPRLDEVRSFLGENNALIVHFSGPKGDETDPEVWFPKDLLAVIGGRSMNGVSACLVTASDTIDNCWGSIGLILAPTKPASLVVAWHTDCGTIKRRDGDFFWREVQDEPDIDRAALDNSLSRRGAQNHNEWVLRDFKVIAALAVAPFMAGFDQNNEAKVGLGDLRVLFQGLPIYMLTDGGFERAWPEPRCVVTAAEINSF